MRAIVIKRHLSAEELTAVLRMAESGGHDIFSSVDIPAQLATYNKGTYEIPEEEKKKINYDIMDFVISFGDKEFEGKPVVEWLKFDDSSIWYYHKFRAYFHLRNLKYLLAEIRSFSKRYDSVIYYISESLIQETNIPQNVGIHYSTKQPWPLRNYISLFNYLIILLSRAFINLFSFRKLNNREHIIIDFTKSQAILDINTLEVTNGNYGIGYLLDIVEDNFLIIDESIQPKFSDRDIINLSFKNLFGKGSLKHRHFGEPLLLNYFLSYKTRQHKKKLSLNISNALAQLRDMRLEDDEKLLINIYRFLHGATSFHLIKYLSYKKFFGHHQFKTITTVDENSPARKAILDAAKFHNIKTIGIQHGTLHNLHPAYVHTTNDIKRNAVPDYNLVWGPYWKEFLINKGNYKAESLSIIGQIRTDVIPMLDKASISKEKVFPEMHSEEKLIVFASQPQRDPQLRRRAAEDVMKAVKATPDGFLLIKLHPNEKNDRNYYANIAKEIGLERIMITLSVDLYLLISVCDILITCFSTVGTETIYFGKPLIILDHLKQDIQNYHKEGVAFQASNEKELEDHIASILNGNADIDKEAYERFISKYAFAIDGKASERAIGFIRGL